MNSFNDFRSKWISFVSSNEPHKFDRRLDWDNLSQDEFFTCLQSPDIFFSIEFLNFNEKYISLVQKFLFDNSELPIDVVLPSEYKSFVDLWSPLKICLPQFLVDSYPHLTKSCTSQSLLNLIDLLISRLVDLSDYLLWTEFLKFRRPGQFFLAQINIHNNQLPPRSIYQDFIFSLRRDSLSSLFSTYPVYKFFIGVTFSHWLSFIVELLERITNDRTSLQLYFSIPSSFLLSAIDGDLSDSHRFGRSVLILTFVPSVPGSLSQQFRLVYKPKSLELELKYYNFLTYLNSSSTLPPFRILKILSKCDYGFVEYISRDLLTLQADLPDFYCFLGRLSSVLLLLGCTDLHHENLIVSSNQLVLVDAETIFDSTIDVSSSASVSGGPTELERLVFRSLLTCGLLPFWTHYGPHNIPIDISAIGIESPQSSTTLKDGWLYINTDAMLSGSVETTSIVPSTLPYEIGSSNLFQNYIEDFISGFQSQSEVLIDLRDLLLIDDGPIDSFRGVKRRALIRSTQIYYTVQRQQFSPLALSSFFDQFLVLEQLSLGYLTSRDKPNNWPIFHSEQHQMINLDIPMFEHKIGSDIFSTSLNSTANLSFSDSHASVRKRLKDLDSSAISFQTLLIKGAFDSSSLHKIPYLDSDSINIPCPDSVKPISSAVPDYSHIWQLTLQQLVSNVYYDNFYRCQWLGCNLSISNVYSFFALNCSLFSGIAAFPSYLQIAFNDNDHVKYISSESDILDKIKTSTKSTMSFWIDHPDHSTILRWWRDSPHGLNGCGGHLLSLSISSTPDIDRLFIPEIFELCTNNLRVSLLNGSVGLIPALTTIGTPSALDLSDRLGKHICTELISSNSFSFEDQHFPLGFFHGTSGLISVFSRLFHFSPESQFLELARTALDYERHFYDLEHLIPPVIHTSFCAQTTYAAKDRIFSFDLATGLSGVLLSRLCLHGTPLWDETCLKEVHHFVKFLLDHRHLFAGINLSHGRLGPLSVIELVLKSPVFLPSHLESSIYQFISEQRHIISQELMRTKPHYYPNRGLTLDPLGFFNGLLGISYYFKSIDSHNSNFTTFLTSGLLDLTKDF